MSEEVKRGRGRPKKDPFECINEEWKAAVASSTPDEINKRIAQAAKDEDENQVLKKADEDFANCREAATVAGQVYSDATKVNRAKVAYGRQVLGDKGAK